MRVRLSAAVYCMLLTGSIGYDMGLNMQGSKCGFKDVRLAWSAGYSAASLAQAPLTEQEALHPESHPDKSTLVHAACNPMPDALNSDLDWNYKRCEQQMIALHEWP